MIKTAEYEIVSVGAGKNTHQKVVKPISSSFYEKEKFVFPRTLKDKIKKRVRFLVVLKGKKPICLTEKTPISSELLFIAETSGSLKSALSGLFKEQFAISKKVIFVGVVIVIGVVVYMILSGNLDLGALI